MNKAFKVMSSAALASALLLGTACGNIDAAGQQTAAAASAAKSSGTQNAAKAKAAGVTQQGITLEVSKAFYDGNYIGITLKRSGKGYAGGLTEGKYDEKAGDYIYAKGAIKSVDLFIDGKPMHDYGGGKTLANRPNSGWGQGDTADTARIKAIDPSWLGGNNKAFPDKFKLTAKVTLEGVNKPYTFHMTLQKTKGNTLKPNMTKKYGKLSVTLSKLNLTSTSSRIQLIVKGLEKNKHASVHYEFVDDKGKELEFISGRGTDENNKNGDMYFEYLAGALSKDAKSITIKAYEYEEGSRKGTFKEDSDGNPIKNYIKDLEMTVKVK